MMKARIWASAAALFLVAGCATPGQNRLAEKDPLEGFNRGVWGVNMAVDKAVLKPVSGAYRAVAPRPVRSGVSNFFANLTEPWSFINNLLQGKPDRAGQNLGRFLVNSTIGIAGLFDHASRIGIDSAPEDFGQTLASWGFNGGPYIVLPFLGPSTLRDTVGTVTAFYGDPVSVGINQADVSVWYKRGYRAAAIISLRSDLTESGGDTFLESSLDPYAAARSAFLQRRRAQILNQENSYGGGEPGGEDVMAPVGEGADAPASAAPLPGDEPAPAGALPESAAPLPGDEPVPAEPAASLPQSAAPLPGDEAPVAVPPRP